MTLLFQMVLYLKKKIAEKIGVSKRAIEMQIANLKAKGLLVREGADHGGYWRIVINPQTEQ